MKIESSTNEEEKKKMKKQRRENKKAMRIRLKEHEQHVLDEKLKQMEKFKNDSNRYLSNERIKQRKIKTNYCDR